MTDFMEEWWLLMAIGAGVLLMHIFKYRMHEEMSWKDVLFGFIFGVLFGPGVVGFWEWISGGMP